MQLCMCIEVAFDFILAYILMEEVFNFTFWKGGGESIV